LIIWKRGKSSLEVSSIVSKRREWKGRSWWKHGGVATGPNSTNFYSIQTRLPSTYVGAGIRAIAVVVVIDYSALTNTEVLPFP
jgi:hypothetical protein